MSSQIDLALKEALKGRPRYFIGKEEILQPKILAKPSILLTIPTGTNYDLAKLIFKPETATKHKKNIPSPHKEARQQPPLTVAEISMPKASITMKNSKGDKGSPCLKPQELKKNKNVVQQYKKTH
jgi:hypothetical protein